MSNGTATATVEVLQATVETLKVGSRQVTLSVYRQLDHVPSSDIEPFGRVRDKRDEPQYADDPRFVHVVGSGPGGALVRSKLWNDPNTRSAPPTPATDEPRWSAEWVAEGAEQSAEKQTLLAEWEALPLLVLAGLR